MDAYKGGGREVAAVLEELLNKMKLFVKMEIFEKIENKTSICFRKTGLTESEDMVTVNHGK